MLVSMVGKSAGLTSLSISFSYPFECCMFPDSFQYYKFSWRRWVMNQAPTPL